MEDDKEGIPIVPVAGSQARKGENLDKINESGETGNGVIEVKTETPALVEEKTRDQLIQQWDDHIIV
jgi:hypothetical protein